MSEQEQAFIDQLENDRLKLRKFIRWIVGIGGSLIVALLVGFASLGAGFNNYIIKHDTEIHNLIKTVDSKVSNAVILEYIKYNDRMIKLVLDGIEKNHLQIEELRKEMKDFELKYFVQDARRGTQKDETELYIPNYHWFACGDDSLYKSLQMVYKGKIGLY